MLNFCIEGHRLDSSIACWRVNLYVAVQRSAEIKFEVVVDGNQGSSNRQLLSAMAAVLM